ncbi:MAG: hypothetical protein NXI04_28520, partial [Planctomycetaceae bacterium]|nr:hypothetical protein [Planctomycetaceae bacterium]
MTDGFHVSQDVNEIQRVRDSATAILGAQVDQTEYTDWLQEGALEVLQEHRAVVVPRLLRTVVEFDGRDTVQDDEIRTHVTDSIYWLVRLQEPGVISALESLLDSRSLAQRRNAASGISKTRIGSVLTRKLESVPPAAFLTESLPITRCLIEQQNQNDWLAGVLRKQEPFPHADAMLTAAMQWYFGFRQSKCWPPDWMLYAWLAKDDSSHQRLQSCLNAGIKGRPIGMALRQLNLWSQSSNSLTDDQIALAQSAYRFLKDTPQPCGASLSDLPGALSTLCGVVGKPAVDEVVCQHDRTFEGFRAVCRVVREKPELFSHVLAATLASHQADPNLARAIVCEFNEDTPGSIAPELATWLNASRSADELIAEITEAFCRKHQKLTGLAYVPCRQTRFSHGTVSDKQILKLAEHFSFARQRVQRALDQTRSRPHSPFGPIDKRMQLLSELGVCYCLEKKITQSYSGEVLSLAKATGGLITVDELYLSHLPSCDFNGNSDHDDGLADETPESVLHLISDKTHYQCPRAGSREDVVNLVWFFNQIAAHLHDTRRFHAFCDDHEQFWVIFATEQAANFLTNTFDLGRAERTD